MPVLVQATDPLIPDELIAFVGDFRREARKYTPKSFPPFPKGSCSWACEILGQLLELRGFGAWELVKARATGFHFGQVHTHDWLENDGIIIDPTADQFISFPAFAGKSLPFIHVGQSPISEVFTVMERRDVLDEGVHPSAQGSFQLIKAALNL